MALLIAPACEEHRPTEGGGSGAGTSQVRHRTSSRKSEEPRNTSPSSAPAHVPRVAVSANAELQDKDPPKPTGQDAVSPVPSPREEQADKLLIQVLEFVRHKNWVFAHQILGHLERNYPDTQAARKAKARGLREVIETEVRDQRERERVLEHLLSMMRRMELPSSQGTNLLGWLANDEDFQKHRDRPEFRALYEYARALADGTDEEAREAKKRLRRVLKRLVEPETPHNPTSSEGSGDSH